MRLQGTISTYLLTTTRHRNSKNFFITTNKTINQFITLFSQVSTLLDMATTPFSIILCLASTKFPSFFNSSNTSVSHFTSFNSPTNQCKGASSTLKQLQKKNHFLFYFNVKVRMKHFIFVVNRSISNIVIPMRNQIFFIR